MLQQQLQRLKIPSLPQRRMVQRLLPVWMTQQQLQRRMVQRLLPVWMTQQQLQHLKVSLVPRLVCRTQGYVNQFLQQELVGELLGQGSKP
jgi:hypothetical protein